MELFCIFRTQLRFAMHAIRVRPQGFFHLSPQPHYGKLTNPNCTETARCGRKSYCGRKGSCGRKRGLAAKRGVFRSQYGSPKVFSCGRKSSLSAERMPFGRKDTFHRNTARGHYCRNISAATYGRYNGRKTHRKAYGRTLVEPTVNIG